jgi:hypothetical protein
MAQSTSAQSLNSCPTRIDGHSVLFAHQVTESMCQKRQRDGYHKCFTCVHNNRVRGLAPAVKELKKGELDGRAAG